MMDDGWRCRFGLSDEGLVDAVNSMGFKAEAWSGDGLNLGPTDALVVDGYHYDPQLLKRWRAQAGVILAIDDLAERPVPADVVLNHNLYGADLDYSAYGAMMVIGGADYALVDQRFFAAMAKPRPTPKHVLVSFGGMDDGSLSLPVAELLLVGESGAVVEVVISSLRSPLPEFASLQERYGAKFILHHNADIVDVMSRCSVLAGSAGVTVLEALAAGLELVVCASFDNQRLNVRALRKIGIAAFDSCAPDDMATVALALVTAHGSQQNNPLDGQGPHRVMDVLTQILMTKGGNEESLA